MLNCEYFNSDTQFFNNCIDLTNDAENSFYKRHIKLNINDPEKTNYRIRNSAYMNYTYTHNKFLKYIQLKLDKLSI